MKVEIFMPKYGLSMREGTIAQWIKREGERVEKGESIAEATTEKIANSIEAPVSGILSEIIVQEGDTVAVGTVLAFIEEEENGLQEDTEIKEEAPSLEHPSEQMPLEIAREIPMVGVRKVIAARMEESLRRSPQATVTTMVEMSGLISLKDSLAADGRKVSVTDLLVKAVAIALESNPMLNSTVQDGKLILYKTINVGVAVAGEDSLFVPVIRNARHKSVKAISEETRELTDKAKKGRLLPDELSGSTFTLSNMGMYDVDVMTPIINLPEAAILSIGTARKTVVIDDENSIRIRPVATFSLTIDHAAMDGVPAAKFLSTVKRLVSTAEGLQQLIS